MGIPVRCPNPACAKVMSVKVALAGKTGNCVWCGTPVTVPFPGAVAPPSPVVKVEDQEVLLIETACPNRRCGRVIRVKAQYAGRTGKCPGCGTAVKVPDLHGVVLEPLPPPKVQTTLPVNAPAPAPAPPEREGDTSEIVALDDEAIARVNLQASPRTLGLGEGVEE